jgi:uncharacterized membrane protein
LLIESRKKSLYKTLSWRIVGSMLTASLGLMLSNSVTIASGIFIVDFVGKSILYYVHERLWSKIHV